jgi:myo-inositol 2-dehydrogenase/D-chiro-inositol 1-dehydrogenase
VRIGFVGAGAIARRHVEILRARPAVEIAAICDVDERRAEAMAGELCARVHTTLEELIGAGGLDAVFVCTPPALHVDPAVACLERGLAVYVEKPLARSLADGRRIVAAWEESDAVCAVGYQWRSLDVVAELRRLLRGAAPGMLVSRSFGPTELARGDRAVVDAAPPESWFVDPRRSGGILFELASHDIDLQLAVAGPVEAVQAFGSTGHVALAGASSRELHDAIALTLRFAGGGVDGVLVAWSETQEPPVYVLDVLGAELALQLELDPEFRLHGRAHGAAVDMRASADPHESTLDRFLEAVRAGDRGGVACTPADAFGTLSVAVACEQSVAAGGALTATGGRE